MPPIETSGSASRQSATRGRTRLDPFRHLPPEQRESARAAAAQWAAKVEASAAAASKREFRTVHEKGPHAPLLVHPEKPPGMPGRKLREKLAARYDPDKGDQTFDLVMYLLLFGATDSHIAYYVLRHEPSLEGLPLGRRGQEIAIQNAMDIVSRYRPQHDHEGERCSVAACPNRPGWMVR